MRHIAAPLVVVAGVLVASGWAGAPSPPKCSAAAITEGKVVAADGYYQACGPAHGVVLTRGNSYEITGGFCGEPTVASQPNGPSRVHRWVSIGLVTSRAHPVHRGLWLVLTPGNRAGPVQVEDGHVELRGVRAGVRGTAIVANGLRRGTFTVVGHGPLGPTGTRFTGTWACA
jgi:hypothetical protein